MAIQTFEYGDKDALDALPRPGAIIDALAGTQAWHRLGRAVQRVPDIDGVVLRFFPRTTSEVEPTASRLAMLAERGQKHMGYLAVFGEGRFLIPPQRSFIYKDDIRGLTLATVVPEIISPRPIPPRSHYGKPVIDGLRDYLEAAKAQRAPFILDCVYDRRAWSISPNDAMPVLHGTTYSFTTGAAMLRDAPPLLNTWESQINPAV